MENEEDEIHFLLHCPATYDLRVKFLLPMVHFDVYNPLSDIFLNDDIYVIRNTAMYLYKASQRRTEAMPLFSNYVDLFEN